MPKPQRNELLQNAGLSVKRITKMPSGEALEVEVEGLPDRLAFVFDSREEGIELGLRVNFPPDSEFAGIPASSERALSLLGALTASLLGRGLKSHFVSGARGLEAVLVSAHLCPAKVNPEHLRSVMGKVRQTADDLAAALAERGSGALDRIASSIRFRVASPNLLAPKSEAVIVPTFDEGVRDELMKRQGNRKKT